MMRAMVFMAFVAAALLPSHASMAQSPPAAPASPSAPGTGAPTGGAGQAPAISTPSAGSSAAPVTAAPAQPAVPTQEVAVSNIIEKDLVTSDGKELGDIEQVVENSADKKKYLVVSSGGVLGFFENQVVLPLDRVAVKDNQLIAREMTEDQIKSLPEFDSSTYRDIGASETLTIAEMQ